LFVTQEIPSLSSSPPSEGRNAILAFSAFF
jgi:hypothetical protein